MLVAVEVLVYFRSSAHSNVVPKLRLESVVCQLREMQPMLHDRYGVSGLWVFGSYVSGEQKHDSDLDLLVEFECPGMTLLKFIDLEMYLSEHLGLKVDLVQRRALRPRIRPNVLAEAVAV